MASTSKIIALKDTSVSLSSPKDLVEFATTLKSFIVEQKLYMDIKGKNYVLVEAWEFAGAAMGIMPVVTKTERVDTGDHEIKYAATVELHRMTDQSVVGSGVAICSNKEKGRDEQDEYVISSMAQTRAIGKAYRNSFAWLMKMAGYEATPAEEMRTSTSTGPEEHVVESEIEEKINDAQSIGELQSVMESLDVDSQKRAAPLVRAKMKELTTKAE